MADITLDIAANTVALDITQPTVSLELGLPAPTNIVRKTDTDVSGNSWVLDEDDFASDSATKVPTQQSVKAYVDALNVVVLDGVGDNSTDNTDALQAAIDGLGGAGRLVIPPGRFRIDSGDIAATGKIEIVGHGAASELIFTDGTKLAYSGTHAEFDGDYFAMRDLRIRADGAGSQNVIDVSFSNGSGGTNLPLLLENLDMGAYDSAAVVRAYIRLNNARNCLLDNIRILGDRDGGTVDTEYGIDIAGSADPVEIALSKVQAYYLQRAVNYSGSIEGVSIDKMAAVKCLYGVVGSTTSGGQEPWFALHHSHLNTSLRGVKLTDIVQYTIDHNSFYHSSVEGSETEYIGVETDQTANNSHGQIIGNHFFTGASTTTRLGVSIGNGSATENVNIESNHFDGFTTGILLETSTTGCQVRGNDYFNTTTSITDSGSSNYIERDSSGTKDITGNLNANSILSKSGNIFSQALNSSSNSHYFLRDHLGANQGVFYWDRTPDDVVIRNYTSGGNKNLTLGGDGVLDWDGNTVLDTSHEDSLYQSVPSEGAFADGDKTKLDGIESGATADQVWGEIGGTLSNQTDLQNALNAKADLAGETYSGTHDFSGATLTLANNQISGDKIDGGTISDFASTGIDDNAASTAVTIDSSGNVGIGEAAPDSKLEVAGSGRFTSNLLLAGSGVTPAVGANIAGAILSPSGQILATRDGNVVAAFNRKTNDGDVFGIYQDGSLEGSISVSGTTVTYGTFLGSHPAQFEVVPPSPFLRGTIVESIDDFSDRRGRDTRMPKVKISQTANSKAVYGTVLGPIRDEETGEYYDDYYNIGAVGLGFVRLAPGVVPDRGDAIVSNGDGTGVVLPDITPLTVGVKASILCWIRCALPIDIYDDGSMLFSCSYDKG